MVKILTILFGFGNEKILVIINGNKVEFTNTSFGAQKTTIEGLQLSHQGVIKEHPDLKDRYDWREQAVIRFNEKLNSFDTEEEIANYLTEDLRKFGYVPEQKQKEGFKPVKIE